MKFAALAALLAMICLAGVVSADNSVTVSGNVFTSFGVGTPFTVSPTLTYSGDWLTVGGTNTASGTVSVSTNAPWHLSVTGAHMTSGSNILAAPLTIAFPSGTPATAQAIPTTTAIDFPAFISTQGFTLYQAVTMSDPAGNGYSTSLTFTAAADI
jgi:hypothetical protein